MKKIRRDTLMRLAAAGRLVSTETYSFDDVYGSSRETVELPVRLMDPEKGNDDWKDGYCNMRVSAFKSGCGACYYSDEEKGLVTLYIHSNHNVSFRVLPKGEKLPDPIPQDDPRRRAK